MGRGCCRNHMRLGHRQPLSNCAAAREISRCLYEFDPTVAGPYAVRGLVVSQIVAECACEWREGSCTRRLLVNKSTPYVSYESRMITKREQRRKSLMPFPLA